MGALRELLTARLRLRSWRTGDLEAFAVLNADPCVTRVLPRALSGAESAALAARAQALGSAAGGCGALELRDSGAFIGYLGLAVRSFHAHFTPCVESDRRLARPHKATWRAPRRRPGLPAPAPAGAGTP